MMWRRKETRNRLRRVPDTLIPRVKITSLIGKRGSASVERWVESLECHDGGVPNIT